MRQGCARSTERARDGGNILVAALDRGIRWCWMNDPRCPKCGAVVRLQDFYTKPDTFLYSQFDGYYYCEHCNLLISPMKAVGNVSEKHNVAFNL